MASLGWFILAVAGLPGPDRAQEEDDICEAVFRHLFDNNASARQQKAAAYFLAVHGRDPGTAFMVRFAGATPPVKRRSECTKSASVGVVDRVTGRSGLCFEIDRIHRHGDSEAEVDGGYYEDGLSASGNTFRLERRGGRWKVVGDVMHWIS